MRKSSQRLQTSVQARRSQASARILSCQSLHLDRRLPKQLHFPCFAQTLLEYYRRAVSRVHRVFELGSGIQQATLSIQQLSIQLQAISTSQKFESLSPLQLKQIIDKASQHSSFLPGNILSLKNLKTQKINSQLANRNSALFALSLKIQSWTLYLKQWALSRLNTGERNNIFQKQPKPIVVSLLKRKRIKQLMNVVYKWRELQNNEKCKFRTDNSVETDCYQTNQTQEAQLELSEKNSNSFRQVLELSYLLRGVCVQQVVRLAQQFLSLKFDNKVTIKAFFSIQNNFQIVLTGRSLTQQISAAHSLLQNVIPHLCCQDQNILVHSNKFTTVIQGWPKSSNMYELDCVEIHRNLRRGKILLLNMRVQEQIQKYNQQVLKFNKLRQIWTSVVCLSLHKFQEEAKKIGIIKQAFQSFQDQAYSLARLCPQIQIQITYPNSIMQNPVLHNILTHALQAQYRRSNYYNSDQETLKRLRQQFFCQLLKAQVSRLSANECCKVLGRLIGNFFGGSCQILSQQDILTVMRDSKYFKNWQDCKAAKEKGIQMRLSRQGVTLTSFITAFSKHNYFFIYNQQFTLQKRLYQTHFKLLKQIQNLVTQLLQVNHRNQKVTFRHKLQSASRQIIDLVLFIYRRKLSFAFCLILNTKSDIVQTCLYRIGHSIYKKNNKFKIYFFNRLKVNPTSNLVLNFTLKNINLHSYSIALHSIKIRHSNAKMFQSTLLGLNRIFQCLLKKRQNEGLSRIKRKRITDHYRLLVRIVWIKFRYMILDGFQLIKAWKSHSQNYSQMRQLSRLTYSKKNDTSNSLNQLTLQLGQYDLLVAQQMDTSSLIVEFPKYMARVKQQIQPLMSLVGKLFRSRSRDQVRLFWRNLQREKLSSTKSQLYLIRQDVHSLHYKVKQSQMKLNLQMKQLQLIQLQSPKIRLEALQDQVDHLQFQLRNRHLQESFQNVSSLINSTVQRRFITKIGFKTWRQNILIETTLNTEYNRSKNLLLKRYQLGFSKLAFLLSCKAINYSTQAFRTMAFSCWDQSRRFMANSEVRAVKVGVGVLSKSYSVVNGRNKQNQEQSQVNYLKRMGRSDRSSRSFGKHVQLKKNFNLNILKK